MVHTTDEQLISDKFVLDIQRIDDDPSLLYLASTLSAILMAEFCPDAERGIYGGRDELVRRVDAMFDCVDVDMPPTIAEIKKVIVDLVDGVIAEIRV